MSTKSRRRTGPCQNQVGHHVTNNTALGRNRISAPSPDLAHLVIATTKETSWSITKQDQKVVTALYHDDRAIRTDDIFE